MPPDASPDIRATDPPARRTSAAAIASACWLSLLAGAAVAQPSAERRFERAIRQVESTDVWKIDTSLGLTERSVLDFGGFLTFTALNLIEGDGNSRRLLQPLGL